MADLPEVIAGRETPGFGICGVVLFLGIEEPGQKVFMMCPQGGCVAVPGLFGDLHQFPHDGRRGGAGGAASAVAPTSPKGCATSICIITKR